MPRRSLHEYYRKRDPNRTPEPFGSPAHSAPATPQTPHRFVVQQHAARRMHWDFRLEIDGVLVSWAVPRGPSVDPKEKRLAVQTEDHPLAYGDFEGIIPPGNYGAGAVILWDRGTYATADRISPGDALKQGKLDVELRGHKLTGRWTLVRTKRGKGNEWLLFKKASGLPVPAEPVIAQPGSILSGLTVEELRAGESRTDELAAMAQAGGAPRRTLGRSDLAPMKADTAEQPFSRGGWIFEIKHDGIRVIAVRNEDRVHLYSRNRRDITASFPEIALAVRHLPCQDFVIDGEIVALDERGLSSFEILQQRLGLSDEPSVERATVEVPAFMYAFDLLAAAGYDFRPLPLTTRKQALSRLVPKVGVVSYLDHVETDGVEFFRAATELGLEGMVAKRADSAYASGKRSPDWLKLKAVRTADLAVVGFIPGKGSRKRLGSLMLGWRKNGGFRYAGNVGSGLDEQTIDSLLAAFEPIQAPNPTAEEIPADVARTATFVEPRLVAEVRYSEVLRSGVLRQPVFLRIRHDKSVSECDRMREATWPLKVLVRPSSSGDPASSPPRKRGSREAWVPATAGTTPDTSRSSETRLAAARPKLQLGNLNKVFWPTEGYTKGDLLAYYESVWPHLQPYLRDRPVVLTRYPDGIEGKSFFQKNAPDFAPEWATTYRIEDTDYFICNNRDTLLYVINSGCIPLHVWSARIDDLNRPDWAILDLDPKGAPFAQVVEVARWIHSLLESLKIPSFVKTSGQDGLHVLIPLAAQLTHHDARAFAELLARIAAGELAAIATVARPLRERGGKVYVDFLQNGFGKTIAGPFSVRPRPGAPVSTPLEWREVSARLDPTRFTIKTVPARLKRKTDPMLDILDTRADVEGALAALAKRVG
jgi:bifunctional non-homologous end joining protein LigD